MAATLFHAHLIRLWKHVFLQNLVTDSCCEHVVRELPAPKKKCCTSKEPDKVKQCRKALLKTERQKLEGHVKKLDCDKISLYSFEEVRSQKEKKIYKHFAAQWTQNR